MTKEEFKKHLFEINKKEQEIKKQFKIDIETIEEEKHLLEEEYAIQHSLYKIGNEIIFTNIDGIEYNRIIHSIKVLNNGDIVYDIGDIIKITHINVYKGRLKKNE